MMGNLCSKVGSYSTGKEITAFYRTRRLITCSQQIATGPCRKPVENCLHDTLIPVLILSPQLCAVVLSGLFTFIHFRFTDKSDVGRNISHVTDVYYMLRPSHVLDLISLIKSGEE